MLFRVCIRNASLTTAHLAEFNLLVMNAVHGPANAARLQTSRQNWCVACHF